MPQSKVEKSKAETKRVTPKARPATAARAKAASAAQKSKKSNKASKAKRNPRPPKAVRLSQADRRYKPVTAPPPRPGVSVTIHLGGVTLPPKLSARLKTLQTRAAPPLRPLRRLITASLARLPIAPRYRRPVSIAAGVIILAAVFVGIHSLGVTSGPTEGTATAAERTAPDFKPLVPAEQASTTQYDGKRNMVSYSATFSGARLTVSQQHLPTRFSQDQMALKAAADSIQATQRLDTSNGPLYIATRDTQDQLAVFAGKDVLLFIHSDRKLDDVSWKSFIEQLRS